MYNIEKLISCMESKFEVKDEDDLVFKEKFKELKNHIGLVKDCKKPFYIEYEDMSMYWHGVGKFDIGIIDEGDNKIKQYEISLCYSYPQDEIIDGEGILPTTPTLIVKCGSLEEIM